MTTPTTVLHGPTVNFSQNQIGIKRLNDTQNSLWNNNWTNRVTIIESMLFSGQQGTISGSQAQLLTTKTISPTNISQNVHKTSKKCCQKQKQHQKCFQNINKHFLWYPCWIIKRFVAYIFSLLVKYRKGIQSILCELHRQEWKTLANNKSIGIKFWSAHQGSCNSVKNVVSLKLDTCMQRMELEILGSLGHKWLGHSSYRCGINKVHVVGSVTLMRINEEWFCDMGVHGQLLDI